MDPAFATMLVLGCTEYMLVCNELPHDEIKYHSMTTCEESVPDTIYELTDYPTVLVKCLPIPEVADTGELEVVWFVDRTRNLRAYVDETGP